MIGLVVSGYDKFPEAMLVALQLSTVPQENICAVPLKPSNDRDEIEAQRQALRRAVLQVDSGEGVLMLVDSFAESAHGQIAVSLMREAIASSLPALEIVAGVNLPMLCEVAYNRHAVSLQELGKIARDEGRGGIILHTRGP